MARLPPQPPRLDAASSAKPPSMERSIETRDKKPPVIEFEDAPAVRRASKPPVIEFEEPPEATPAPKVPPRAAVVSPDSPPMATPGRDIKAKKTSKLKVRDLIVASAESDPMQDAQPPPPIEKPAPVLVAAAEPVEDRPLEPASAVRESSGWMDGIGLMCSGPGDAVEGHLDVGLRLNHYWLQTERDDYIGSIDWIEARNYYIDHRPFLDDWWLNGLFLLWRFNDKIAAELTYTEMRVITWSNGGNHTDGTLIVAGPILTAIRRFPNATTYTPYAGLGLAFFLSTSVTGDNPWHNGFGGRDWEGYNAWREQGSPAWPNDGYQRTFTLSREIGYVLSGGLEKSHNTGVCLSSLLRLTHELTEQSFPKSSRSPPPRMERELGRQQVKMVQGFLEVPLVDLQPQPLVNRQRISRSGHALENAASLMQIPMPQHAVECSEVVGSLLVGRQTDRTTEGTVRVRVPSQEHEIEPQIPVVESAARVERDRPLEMRGGFLEATLPPENGPYMTLSFRVTGELGLC